MMPRKYRYDISYATPGARYQLEGVKEDYTLSHNNDSDSGYTFLAGRLILCYCHNWKVCCVCPCRSRHLDEGMKSSELCNFNRTIKQTTA